MKRIVTPPTLPTRQKGVSLLVAVVFLLVLALLGISALQSSMLQEKMATNTRNRDLAFEAAEAALREAEATLTSWRTLAIPTHDPALDNDPAYWTSTADWSDGTCTAAGTSCRVMSTLLAKVAAQPKYRLEKMAPVSTSEYYRVTARGTGVDTDTIVILQAIIKYTP